MTSAPRFSPAAAALSLLVAAALHAGLVIPGRFDDAAMYETGVAIVLLIGLGMTFLAGVAANNVADLVYRVALIALLLVGIADAW